MKRNEVGNSAAKSFSYTPLSVAALLFALVSGAVEAVLMLRYFQPYITVSTGQELFCFYSNTTSLPGLFYIVVASVIAALVIFGFISQKRAPEPDEKPSALTGVSVFMGLICGFALVAATVVFALGLHRSGSFPVFDKPVDIITAALVICAVPAALYFIVVSFGGYKKLPVAVLGSFAVLWAALLLLRLYFMRDTSLRSPTRILGQMAPIGIMLYLVQELRYRVGAKRAALFRAMAAAALIVITLDSVMTAVLVLNWGVTDMHLPFKAVEACIGVYIAVNMFYLPAGIKFSAALHIDEKKKMLKELRRIREDREADAYLRDLIDDTEEPQPTEDGDPPAFTEPCDLAPDCSDGMTETAEYSMPQERPSDNGETGYDSSYPREPELSAIPEWLNDPAPDERSGAYAHTETTPEERPNVYGQTKTTPEVELIESILTSSPDSAEEPESNEYNDGAVEQAVPENASPDTVIAPATDGAVCDTSDTPQITDESAADETEEEPQDPATVAGREAVKRIAGYQAVVRKSLIDSISEADTDALPAADCGIAEPDKASTDGASSSEPVKDMPGTGASEDKDAEEKDELAMQFELLRDAEADDGFDSSSDMD